MKNRCKFGIELPYNVIDPFLNRTDQFFSLIADLDQALGTVAGTQRSPDGKR